MTRQRVDRPGISDSGGAGRDAAPFIPSVASGIFITHFPVDAQGKAWLASAALVSTFNRGWNQ